MKSILSLISLSILLAAHGIVAQAPAPRYSVTDLGTLPGGAFSIGLGVNNASHVAGGANLPNGNQHPFLWVSGNMMDLGTLGGSNGNAAGPNGNGELAVLSETSTTDPLGEDFCAFGTGLICLGAVWQNGVLTPLPTLGGKNAAAITLNSLGQVAGVAETGTPDATCKAPQQIQFEAVVWGPEHGAIQLLHPLAGDTVGFALAVNDRHQAVGSSGTCANTPLFPMPFGPHAVLWQNGSPIDLGTLGGTFNTAAAINNSGAVTGGSNLPGDTALHTFLWTKATGMQDLRTVDADTSSFPGAINDKGQIVGASCDVTLTVCRAYLWQSSIGMVDLNTLIPASSPLYLLLAFGLSEDGKIAGLAFDTTSGELHAFLATPTGNEGVAPPARGRANFTLPENVRKLLQQRIAFGRLGVGLSNPR